MAGYLAAPLNRVPEDSASSTVHSDSSAPSSRTASTKPRPVSMPPQSFHQQDAQQPTPAPQEEQPHHHRKHRGSARSNRVLGDYTIGKTLGAGSMGKVKLAVHNVSGEKVRQHFLHPLIVLIPSSLARHQNSPKSQPCSSTSKWRNTRSRRCKAGLKGRLKRNSHPPRGSPFHAATSPLHLRHARNDRPSTSLLHGL